MNLPNGYSCPECGAGAEWQEFESYQSMSGNISQRVILCFDCGKSQTLKEGEKISELGDYDE